MSRTIELRTTGKKTIPKIVGQEETRRSLTFERRDRCDYIGDHDESKIALLTPPRELRSDQ